MINLRCPAYSEGGGIVESIGAGVTDVAVGDHVIPVSDVARATGPELIRCSTAVHC